MKVLGLANNRYLTVSNIQQLDKALAICNQKQKACTITLAPQAYQLSHALTVPAHTTLITRATAAYGFGGATLNFNSDSQQAVLKLQGNDQIIGLQINNQATHNAAIALTGQNNVVVNSAIQMNDASLMPMLQTTANATLQVINSHLSAKQAPLVNQQGTIAALNVILQGDKLSQSLKHVTMVNGVQANAQTFAAMK